MWRVSFRPKAAIRTATVLILSTTGTNGDASRSHYVPRFHFHLHNNLDVPDAEGEELPGVEAAIRYAEICARLEVVQAVKDGGRINLGHRIDIEDGIGRVLDTVWFRDVVEIDS